MSLLPLPSSFVVPAVLSSCRPVVLSSSVTVASHAVTRIPATVACHAVAHGHPPPARLLEPAIVRTVTVRVRSDAGLREVGALKLWSCPCHTALTSLHNHVFYAVLESQRARHACVQVHSGNAGRVSKNHHLPGPVARVLLSSRSLWQHLPIQKT